jgi:superfamily I DNA and/or RNA helicase
MEIEKLGAYLRVSEITETGNAHLFDVQGPDGQIYLAKVPKNLDSTGAAARQFSSVARHLKNIKNDFINKVIDSGEEPSIGCFFIVLQKIEHARTLEVFTTEENDGSGRYLKEIIQFWLQCAEALGEASVKNIFHKDIHPRNILISKDRVPVIIDFGISILEHTISKRPIENEYGVKFAAPEYIIRQEAALKARTDFYSLSLTMLYCLLGHKLFYEIENNEKRLERVLSVYKSSIPIQAVPEFENVFRKSFDADSGLRYFQYTELRAALNKLFEVINHTPEKPFAFTAREDLKISEFIAEINKSGFSISVNEQRHNIHKNITAKIASLNFYVARCHLSNRGNALMIMEIKSKEGLERNEKDNHQYVFDNGHKVDNIQFLQKNPSETNPEQYYDIHTLLEKLFLDKRDTTRGYLPKTSKDILQSYKTLLNEEISYLREEAFRVKYSASEINGSNGIRFKLVTDEKTTREYINNFLKRSRAAFVKDNNISLMASSDALGLQNRVVLGYSIKYDEKTGYLYINGFPEAQKDEVPNKGYLVEETGLQEVQFKRQINAIRNYENDNITNSELRKYLFQPERLQQLAENSGEIVSELEVISTRDGQKVRFEDAQRSAILKCLFRPPITLVQGPPGTGKTTVITEIIRQLLTKDRHAKILITSQTNLAVDNVLAKLVGIQGVNFIRLGRNIDDEKIDAHSFQNKLNFWARATKSACDKNFATINTQIVASQKNLSPILNQILQEVNKKQDWSVSKKTLLQYLNSPLAKQYSNLTKYLNSKIEFENELSKLLGPEHSALNKIHQLKKKWNAILSNIETEDELKSKFVSSINLVGATSNHIAASLYRDFKFEFDYVIMDEAAKATPAETLVPINMAHNLVLVGDHKQLPPMITATKEVKQRVEEKYNTEGELIDFDKIYSDQPSLFEIMYDGSPVEYKEMLDLQFRMPRQIGDLISRLVYGGRLKSSDKSGEHHNMKLAATSSIFMLNTNKFPNRHHKTDPISKSSYNEANASTILELLLSIDSYTELLKGSGKEKPYEIGIITGYGKQAEFLTNEIGNADLNNIALHKNLTIATVDSFQGSEKDIVIYDIVRSSRPDDKSGLGFLEMPNRINVAFTRAKRLLILVGDAEYVLNVSPSYRWIATNPNEPLLLKQIVTNLHENGLIYDDLKDILYGQ